MRGRQGALVADGEQLIDLKEDKAMRAVVGLLAEMERK